MYFLDKSISILFGLQGVGSHVEIQVSHLALIGTISIQHDFNVSLCGDSFGQEILAYWSSNSRYIESLSDFNDLIESFEAFFGLVDELSMQWINVLGYFPRIDNISPLLHTDTECP